MDKKQVAVDAILRGFVTQFDLDVMDLDDDVLHAVWHAGTGTLNPANMVQGGACYAVADALCALLGYDTGHVLTKSGHFYYFYSLYKGDIHIDCRYAKKGKFTSLVEVEMWQNEVLCMKGTFDMAKMKVEGK